MALDIAVQLLDAYGRTTTKTFGSDRTTIVDALTDLGTLVTAIEAVSDCAVVQHTVTKKTVVAGSPATGANVDAGITIHCTLADSTGYGLKIPAPDPDMINTDGSVKITDEAILAYVALFQSGGHFTVSDGEVIDDIRFGELDR